MARKQEHIFQSAEVDDSDLTLIRPQADWGAQHIIAEQFTNRVGSSLAVGDVVTLSATDDESVVLSDTQNNIRQYYVTIGKRDGTGRALTGIGNLELGFFSSQGTWPTLVSGAVTRGRYLYKSATSRALQDSGTSMGGTTVSPPAGTVGVALQGAAGPGLAIIMVQWFGNPGGQYVNFSFPLGVASGGTGAVGFTQGSVVFAGASGVYTQDNANFFWDDSTNRLGIGTNAPINKIQIANTAAAGGLLLTQGSSASPLTGSSFTGSPAGGVGGYHAVVDIHESLTVSSSGTWGLGALGLHVMHRKVGGTGNRGALDARLNVSGSNSHVNDFYVAGFFLAEAETGVVGKFFGSNPYSWIKSGASTSCDCIGEEINVQVDNAAVHDKVGLQIIDKTTNGAGGANFDVGLYFFGGASNAGFLHGIRFGADAIKTSGIGILFGDIVTLLRGIDMENITCTDGIYMGSNPIRFVEMTDPAAPPTNTMRLYARDNGAGKTQLVARFPTGAIQVIATEP